MILRKVNAGISLIITVLLLQHAIINAAWMLSMGSFTKFAQFASNILFVLMMVHAAISIALAIRGHKGAEKRKCNEYPKLNIVTNIQRFSGIILLPLTVLHVLGTVGVIQPPQAVHAILPPLFFTVALMHTAVSTSKAFITLGIGNVKTVKVIDITIKVVCALTLIADIVGFYLYLV